ncbi:MAG: aminotransferase class I/II-fold pyridoxal phosphate-dependent enzyme [Erysipelotrichaceae bacterium]|nr:aminotransferase class I/II-fold pyridoxal phosphate-dependent enzyme [Erysipelotrichaceae bacterium]
MHYGFDEIIDRKNDKYSFSFKWQIPYYVTKRVGVENLRDDLICLETADMDFRVAPEIIEDLHGLTDHGIFGYSELPDRYFEAVVDWYGRRQDWHFSKDDISYYPGTHKAIEELVKKYTKPNEGVIVLTPCYGYHGDVEGTGRKYIQVEMINDGYEYFTIDYDALEKACKDENNTAIIMCHPHNPTGRIFTHEELVRVGDICRKNNVLIISDEVHSDILRKGQSFEPMMKACGSEGLIACTAVNKTFNLAGLAMTNVIIQDDKLKQAGGDNMYSMPTPFGIQAVISAYTKGENWVNALNEYLDGSIDACLDYIHEHLPKAKVLRPEGGYSLNINFEDYGLSDEEVADKIYGKAGVIMNSGLFFDDKRKLQVHRACLSSPRSMCLEAFARIAKEFENC